MLYSLSTVDVCLSLQGMRFPIKGTHFCLLDASLRPMIGLPCWVSLQANQITCLTCGLSGLSIKVLLFIRVCASSPHSLRHLTALGYFTITLPTLEIPDLTDSEDAEDADAGDD